MSESFEAKRQALHDLERDCARRGPDPVHTLQVRFRRREDRPGAVVVAYFAARWSLAARLARDAQGSVDELADLGPDAMALTQAADFAAGELVLIGVARPDGDRWQHWNLPCLPVEPVPGSRRADAARALRKPRRRSRAKP